MAILVINQTLCNLCNQVLREDEQIFSFPAFISNIKDEIYQFNDSSFHTECLHKHTLGARAIKLSEQFILKTRPENRICLVSGDLIKAYDDYFFIDLLTSSNEEPLFKFNFTTLDRNNLKKWLDRDTFIYLATKFKNGSKWGDISSYKYLDNLIDMLTNLT